MSDIFEEAKEDARIEKIIDFWKAYGKSIIIAAILATLAGFGYVFYESRKQNAMEKEANLYQQLIASLDAGKSEDVDADLKALTKLNPEGYSTLAELRIAAEEFKNTGVVASEIYEKIWNDKKVDEKIRDLSVVCWALQGMAVLDHEKMIARLEPIAASNRVYNVLAAEVMGYALLRANRVEDAQNTFQNLVENKGTPEGVRLRARAMLSRIAGS